MKIIEIPCAFCHSSGKDPFQLLSKLAACQVCEGKGKVEIEEPAVKCAFCSGTGVHPHSRNTCIVCHGKGMLTFTEPRIPCPVCDGTGDRMGDNLPCRLCLGKGVIHPCHAPEKKTAHTG